MQSLLTVTKSLICIIISKNYPPMASDNRGGGGRKPRSHYVDYSRSGHSKFGQNRRQGHSEGFSNNSRYSKVPDISFGNRGFLITTVDEVKSYLEMRGIFEEYFESLYPKQEDEQTGDKVTTTEDEVELELKTLRKNRPFKQVKTHCRNTIFINITNEFLHIDPIRVVDAFFDDLAEKRELRTSNTFKVLPILDTFRNSVACAKESVSNLVQTTFKDEAGPRKYFIEFQTRGNYKLDQDDRLKVIEGVADTLAQVKPEWSVDRESADYIIVFTALKSVCCISILRDYFRRSKYNVTEFCKDFVQTSDNVECPPRSEEKQLETSEVDIDDDK